MNNNSRKKLKEVLVLKQRIYNVVCDVYDKEQESIDNYPENLHGTEIFENMEESVEKLENLLDVLDEVENIITDII